MMERVLQSNESLGTTDDLQMHVSVIKAPRGRGKRNFKLLDPIATESHCMLLAVLHHAMQLENASEKQRDEKFESLKLFFSGFQNND